MRNERSSTREVMVAVVTVKPLPNCASRTTTPSPTWKIDGSSTVICRSLQSPSAARGVRAPSLLPGRGLRLPPVARIESISPAI
ncbi:MAG: hypothetical protein HY721_17945, partial [Planctomycetes bacterium]|nr:hypothetical protein [Planctomycetota bacterium]